MKARKVNGVEHHLYRDVAEFREYHTSIGLVEDWRHSNKGDWILCDDGQVCQVLHLGVMKKADRAKETTFIRTIIGSFVCSPRVKMEGEMRTLLQSEKEKESTLQKKSFFLLNMLQKEMKLLMLI